MAISNDSKKALKEKIVKINEQIAVWKNKLDPLQDKKRVLQSNIDHITTQISSLKSDKQKLQDDIDSN